MKNTKMDVKNEKKGVFMPVSNQPPPKLLELESRINKLYQSCLDMEARFKKDSDALYTKMKSE